MFYASYQDAIGRWPHVLLSMTLSARNCDCTHVVVPPPRARQRYALARKHPSNLDDALCAEILSVLCLQHPWRHRRWRCVVFLNSCELRSYPFTVRWRALVSGHYCNYGRVFGSSGNATSSRNEASYPSDTHIGYRGVEIWLINNYESRPLELVEISRDEYDTQEPEKNGPFETVDREP